MIILPRLNSCLQDGDRQMLHANMCENIFTVLLNYWGRLPTRLSVINHSLRALKYLLKWHYSRRFIKCLAALTLSLYTTIYVYILYASSNTLLFSSKVCLQTWYKCVLSSTSRNVLVPLDCKGFAGPGHPPRLVGTARTESCPVQQKEAGQKVKGQSQDATVMDDVHIRKP